MLVYLFVCMKQNGVDHTSVTALDWQVHYINVRQVRRHLQ